MEYEQPLCTETKKCLMVDRACIRTFSLQMQGETPDVIWEHLGMMHDDEISAARVGSGEAGGIELKRWITARSNRHLLSTRGAAREGPEHDDHLNKASTNQGKALIA